ncbi:AAA family ATPase [Aneurinibacillus sp. REN35]|uniref:AAA family ATPase n=1 Tax=Aneurinibacillus sp. REN35 TaxID=3237286 RepID=UPI003528A2D4
MYLRSVKLLRETISSHQWKQYPLSIPTINALDEIELDTRITFFVGENGSGKSTLLEAIADRCGFNTGGGSRHNSYELEAAESALGQYIRLSWMPKMTAGFFLRAESFYSFATYIDRLAKEAPGYDVYGDYGGKSLHEQSHGESFFSLFTERFKQKGIYLLDEPEAALSPSRQLSFLRLLYEMEQEGMAQFIIATHSPILLAYPGAKIFTFDTAPIAPISYEETSHYFITRRFLERREDVLRDLFAHE